MKNIKYSLMIISSILVLVLIFAIVFTVCNLNKMQSSKSYFDNNLTLYTENKMLKYDGGDKAEDFFPKYLEVENAKEIYFEYCDNTPHTNFFHVFYSYFCLEISFEEDDYLTYVEKLKTGHFGWYGVSNFTVLMDIFEDDNCKAILCNDETKTIRYILFYGDFKEYDPGWGISPAFNWNVCLNPDGSLRKTGWG